MSPGRKISWAGVAAAFAGPLLVVSLYFAWWGVPESVFAFPPEKGTEAPALDGWYVFEYQDVVWLTTGIAALAFGLADVSGAVPVRPLAGLVGILATVSVVLVGAQIISPPTYLELAMALTGEDGGDDAPSNLDVALHREVGPWVALVAAGAITVACAMHLRPGRGRV